MIVSSSFVILAGVISSDSPLYFALKSKKELCDLISVGGNAKILFLYTKDIFFQLNDGETLDDHYMNKQLEEFLAD